MLSGSPSQNVPTFSRPQANARGCNYEDCIVVQSEMLEEVIRIRQRQSRLEGKAISELEKRLKASFGETKDKIVGYGASSQRSKSKSKSERQEASRDNNFNSELIEPCNCGVKYHRVCIRERIITDFLKKCPDCQVGYSVSYTECYAIFNK